MQASDIIQPTVLSTPVAVDGIKNTIPTDPPSSSSNLASITEGFPSITMKSVANGGLPPMGQDFNGLFYLSTDQKVYLQNGGIITFNADVSTAIGGYPQGAVLDYVDSNGIITKVQSLIDNNTYNFVTTPSYIDGTHWQTVLMGVSNKLTNCILSTPNGVATYSGNTITVKQGLKGLYVNGRNSDYTINSLEYTLKEDVSRDVDVDDPTNNRLLYLFLNITSSGVGLTYIDNYNYYEQETQPFEPASGRYGFWYNPYTAEFKITINGGAWTKTILSRIGYYTCFGGQITSLVLDQPVELLKRSDKAQITSWGFPSSKYVDLSLGASGQTYTAPADGWFTLQKLNGSDTAGYYIAFTNQTNQLCIECRQIFGIGALGRIFIPAKKGDVVQVNYDMIGATQHFKFIYAQGATND